MGSPRKKASLFVKAFVFSLALLLGVVTQAQALVGTPDVAMKELTNIATSGSWGTNTYTWFKEATGDRKVDNYGAEYPYAYYNSSSGQIVVEYLLNGKYSNFVTTLYIPKGSGAKNSASLSIKADGKVIYNSPNMDKASKPIDVNVDLKGCNDVVFTIPAGNGNLTVCMANAGFNRLRPSDAAPVNPSGQNIFRMYNPYSGEHLYTTDTNEADALLRSGWDWEGTSSVPNSGDSVYRLCNPYSGEHLYTTSFNEYKTLSGSGWNGEGEKFHSSDSSGKPFYRIYNPWGSGVTAHTYTTDSNELNTLTGGGWKSDGVCWYGLW